MTLARRAEVAITWQSKDITRDIAPFLLSLSYADNLTSAADDLGIELEDREGLWEGDWRPTFGDSVEASVTAEPWLTDVTDLRFGLFAHDKITLKGPPRVVTLLCVSAPLATGLRRRRRTRAWRGVTLRQIAQDIADRAKLPLEWDGPAGRAYTARNQVDKSDLEFLDELSKEVGRTLKVFEDKIVCFVELTLDGTPSIGEIDLAGGHVISWAFDGDDSDKYGSCHISFFDPRSGKTQKAEFPPPGVIIPGLDPDGMTLEVRMPLESLADAGEKAKALLRNANRFATSGKLETVGDPGLLAGVTFDLVGAGQMNGKFIVTKAEHRPLGGYTCMLHVRRCLEGY